MSDASTTDRFVPPPTPEDVADYERSHELDRYEGGHPSRMVSREHLDLLRNTLNPDLTEPELMLFAQVANRVGLDPFARQIYAVKRRSNSGPDRVTFQTGIDGYRLIARRTGEMAGRLGPYFADSDGAWRIGPDGKPLPWLSTTPPAAAMVGVVRHGDTEPTWGIATWAEYAITGAQGKMWEKMPSTMLAKCAEAQAIRACFPAETSGIYTDEEMDQADYGPAGTGGRPSPNGGTPAAGGTVDPWKDRLRDVVDELKRRNLPPGGKEDELRQRLADAMKSDPPAVIDVESSEDDDKPASESPQEGQEGADGQTPAAEPDGQERPQEPAVEVIYCAHPECDADLGETGAVHTTDEDGNPVAYCPDHAPA